LFEYLPKPTIPIIADKMGVNATSSSVDQYFMEEKSFDLRVKDALEAYKVSRFNKDDLS